MLREFSAYAESLKVSPAQLALAWVIKNRDVSVCLFGATKLEQVDDNIKCLELVKRWTPEIEKKMDEIFMNVPEPLLNWRTWTPNQPRRLQMVKYNGNME